MAILGYSPPDLDNFIKSNTYKLEGGRVQCNICDKVTSHGGNMKQHFQTHHFQEDSIPCHLCGKHFKNKNSLSSHVYNSHKRVRSEGLNPQQYWKWNPVVSFVCFEINIFQVLWLIWKIWMILLGWTLWKRTSVTLAIFAGKVEIFSLPWKPTWKQCISPPILDIPVIFVTNCVKQNMLWTVTKADITKTEIDI